MKSKWSRVARSKELLRPGSRSLECKDEEEFEDNVGPGDDLAFPLHDLIHGSCRLVDLSTRKGARIHLGNNHSSSHSNDALDLGPDSLLHGQRVSERQSEQGHEGFVGRCAFHGQYYCDANLLVSLHPARCRLPVNRK